MIELRRRDEKQLIIIDGENCYSKKIHNKIISRERDYDVTVIIGMKQIIHHANVCNEILLSERCNTILKFRQTTRIGKNAADFMIIAMASDESQLHNYDRVKIVSNDEGFDCAIDYLRGRGFKISRLSPDQFSKMLGESKTSIKKTKVAVRHLQTLCGFLLKNLKENSKTDKQHMYLKAENFLGKYAVETVNVAIENNCFSERIDGNGKVYLTLNREVTKQYIH